jgi:hypothetical protein
VKEAIRGDGDTANGETAIRRMIRALEIALVLDARSSLDGKDRNAPSVRLFRGNIVPGFRPRFLSSANLGVSSIERLADAFPPSFAVSPPRRIAVSTHSHRRYAVSPTLRYVDSWPQIPTVLAYTIKRQIAMDLLFYLRTVGCSVPFRAPGPSRTSA